MAELEGWKSPGYGLPSGTAPVGRIPQISTRIIGAVPQATAKPWQAAAASQRNTSAFWSNENDRIVQTASLQDGIANGTVRDENGRLRPSLVGSQTLAGEAWNRGALTSYTQSIGLEARETAQKLAQEFRSDPEGFKAAYGAWKTATLDNIDPRAAMAVGVPIADYGAQAYGRLVEEKYQATRKEQLDVGVASIDAHVKDISDLARVHGPQSNNEELLTLRQRMAADMQNLIDAGLVNEAFRTRMIDKLEMTIGLQGAIGIAERSFNPLDQDAALKFANAISKGTTGRVEIDNLSPSERATISASVRQRMGELANIHNMTVAEQNRDNAGKRALFMAQVQDQLIRGQLSITGLAEMVDWSNAPILDPSKLTVAEFGRLSSVISGQNLTRDQLQAAYENDKLLAELEYKSALGLLTEADLAGLTERGIPDITGIEAEGLSPAEILGLRANLYKQQKADAYLASQLLYLETFAQVARGEGGWDQDRIMAMTATSRADATDPEKLQPGQALGLISMLASRQKAAAEAANKMAQNLGIVTASGVAGPTYEQATRDLANDSPEFQQAFSLAGTIQSQTNEKGEVVRYVQNNEHLAPIVSHVLEKGQMMPYLKSQMTSIVQSNDPLQLAAGNALFQRIRNADGGELLLNAAFNAKTYEFFTRLGNVAAGATPKQIADHAQTVRSTMEQIAEEDFEAFENRVRQGNPDSPDPVVDALMEMVEDDEDLANSIFRLRSPQLSQMLAETPGYGTWWNTFFGGDVEWSHDRLSKPARRFLIDKIRANKASGMGDEAAMRQALITASRSGEIGFSALAGIPGGGLVRFPLESAHMNPIYNVGPGADDTDMILQGLRHVAAAREDTFREAEADTILMRGLNYFFGDRSIADDFKAGRIQMSYEQRVPNGVPAYRIVYRDELGNTVPIQLAAGPGGEATSHWMFRPGSDDWQARRHAIAKEFPRGDQEGVYKFLQGREMAIYAGDITREEYEERLNNWMELSRTVEGQAELLAGLHSEMTAQRFGVPLR